MEAVEALTLISGHVSQEILIRNECLAAENEILKSKLKRTVTFNDTERVRFAKIGKRMGLKALKEVACIVKPETIMAWYRKLIARKFDGSLFRKKAGRPKTDSEIEDPIVKFAEENPSWGYEGIVGTLFNLCYKICKQTVRSILIRNGIPPAPARKQDTSWSKFIKNHQNVIAACDFFTTEVITPVGLITYYVLFFFHLSSRKLYIAEITPNPNEEWMKQIARNITMADWGFLSDCKYLIHDRDSKFCKSFCSITKSGGVEPLKLTPQSPNLNAFSERWVLSIKSECISGLIFFGEKSLLKTLSEYMSHCHHERNHQGKENRLLFPPHEFKPANRIGRIKCRSRLVKHQNEVRTSLTITNRSTKIVRRDAF